MAWQIPKTNWQAADVVSKDDFNRIEGNIQELQDTKETPAGAQAKAEAALNSAKQYTDQEVGEVSQALEAHKAEKASSTILGHVKQGDGVTITDGVIAADVKSVAGKTGTVTLTKSDVGLGNVNNVKQMPIAGGTFTGIAVAQNNTSYGTKQIRNIIISTSDPSGGGNGDIWLKYV